jgi:hypothetical protein
MKTDRITLGCNMVYLLADEPYKTIEESINALFNSSLFTMVEKTKIKTKLKTFRYNGWIPIEFEKPKEKDIVVYDLKKGIKGSVCIDDIFYSNGYQCYEVTHWRYLPSDKPNTKLKTNL